MWNSRWPPICSFFILWRYTTDNSIWEMRIVIYSSHIILQMIHCIYVNLNGKENIIRMQYGRQIILFFIDHIMILIQSHIRMLTKWYRYVISWWREHYWIPHELYILKNPNSSLNMTIQANTIICDTINYSEFWDAPN